MFLTEYFTSVRVPDSATCHPRTPSSTPPSPHYPRIRFPCHCCGAFHEATQTQIPPAGALPGAALSQRDATPSPGQLYNEPSRVWATWTIGRRAETIPERGRETADEVYRWMEDLFRNARDLINDSVSYLPGCTKRWHITTRAIPKNLHVVYTETEVRPKSKRNSHDGPEKAPKSDKIAFQDNLVSSSVTEFP